MPYSDYVQEEDTWKYLTYFMVILVVGGLILVYFFAINKNNLSKSSNEHMAQMYPTINPDLSSIDSEYNYPLFDYYIYSSFNSCSAGDYRDGVVSTDALLSVIRQGARFLDFQIFNENGEPVVATSTEKGNNYVKTSLNSISFGEVMNTVALNAFSDNAPNKSDPLIVHLRVMSNQVSIYDKIAEIFKQYDDRMLSASTSFADANTNFGLFPLHKARNKIIVFVDGSNNTYLQSDSFYEYVNMVSNSPFLWLLSNYDVVNYPNIEDLTNSNRTNMTIVTPNMGESSPTNPSILLAQEYGCQIVAMRFQEDDQYLQEANNFFKTSGQSFVLKPEELREKKVEIPDPVPQNPEYSYATREVKNNLYSFKY